MDMIVDKTRASTELLYQPSERLFGAVAEALVANGWAVYPQDREGARRPAPGVLPEADHQLSQHLPTPGAVRDWCIRFPCHNAAAVMGAGSRGALAVDIDCTDQAAVDVVSDVAEAVLGYTPLRREGMAPKLALIFRSDPADPVRNAKRVLEAAGPDGGEQAIEILSRGKALTIHGLHHKTGRYFKWLDENPILSGPDTAPMVTQAQVTDFFERLAGVLPLKPAHSPGGGAPVSWADAAPGAEGILVPTLKTKDAWTKDSDGLISDGRESLLNDLAFRVVTANASKGVIDRDAFVKECGIGVVAAFRLQARMGGKWSEDYLRRNAMEKVARKTDALLRGDIAPSRRAPRPSFLPPPPEVAAAQGAKAEAAADQPAAPAKICLVAGEIESTVSQAEAALARSGRGVYQRGGAVVQLGTQPMKTFAGDEISAQRVFEVGNFALREHLSAAAEWVRTDPKDKDREIRCSPPMWVAATLQERRGRLRLPVLAAVVNAPTLRPDGTILDKPGYDAATGIIYDPGGTAFPPIAEFPTHEDARAAIGVLDTMHGTFPWVSDEDRAVGHSTFVTPLVRQSIGTAPVHALTAPTPSTGKSKVIDMASILLTGRAAGVTEFASDPAELEKRLSSELMAGSSFITIDNVPETAAFDSAFLNQLVTQRTVRPRVLGKSETRELPTAVFLAATGNNLVVAGDMTSRTLLGTLDAKCADPDRREFAKDALDIAKEMRPQAVVAALTIVRAYLVAGRPDVGGVGTRFPEWQKWVRDALMWAGAADAAKTMDKAKAHDPRRNSITGVLSWWNRVIGKRRVTTADVISFATQQNTPSADTAWRAEFVHPGFREVLLEVAAAGGGGLVSSNRLGRWIGGIVERRVGGMRVVRAGISSGQPTWQLMRDEDERG